MECFVLLSLATNVIVTRIKEQGTNVLKRKIPVPKKEIHVQYNVTCLNNF